MKDGWYFKIPRLPKKDSLYHCSGWDWPSIFLLIVVKLVINQVSPGVLVQLQDHIRVGTIGQPFILLRKFANPGIISRPITHLQYQLEMKMGWPLPVLRWNAKGSKNISLIDPVSFLYILDRVSAEMNLQCIKMKTIQDVGKDDRCPVINRPLMKSKTVNDPLQGCHNGRTGLSPDIDTEV